MQTGEVLREPKELFSMFIDYLPEIVFIKDEKSTTLYVNKHMNHVLGAKEWIGKTPIDLFPKDLADKMISDDRKLWMKPIGLSLKLYPIKMVMIASFKHISLELIVPEDLH